MKVWNWYIVYLSLTELNTMPNHIKFLKPTNPTNVRKPHMSSVAMNINIENYETCLEIPKTKWKQTQTNDSWRPHQYTSCPIDSPTKFTKLFCPCNNILCVFIMFSSSNINSWEFDPLFGLLANLPKATISFVNSVRLSVRPHGTTQNPLVGLSWNLILVCFVKPIVKFQVFKIG